jgi:hypothetical protein
VTTSSATWRSQALHQRHFQGSVHGRTVEERLLGKGRANQRGAVGVTAFFSLAASYPFGGGTGACRGRWSASRSEARRGAARGQLKEEKRKERVVGKSGGGRTLLYT